MKLLSRQEHSLTLCTYSSIAILLAYMSFHVSNNTETFSSWLSEQLLSQSLQFSVMKALMRSSYEELQLIESSSKCIMDFSEVRLSSLKFTHTYCRELHHICQCNTGWQFPFVFAILEYMHKFSLGIKDEL